VERDRASTQQVAQRLLETAGANNGCFGDRTENAFSAAQTIDRESRAAWVEYSGLAYARFSN
jgi:hypothetical protein